VFGTIESGVDFEKRILAIYQECRTSEEIDAAFRTLQAEMDEQIRTRMDDTRRTLFEHFDDAGASRSTPRPRRSSPSAGRSNECSVFSVRGGD
jgi:hypothetical protein